MKVVRTVGDALSRSDGMIARRRLMEREEMVESVMGSWRSFGLVGEFVVFLWGKEGRMVDAFRWRIPFSI